MNDNIVKDQVKSAVAENADAYGKQVRIVPELVFYIDEVEENAQRIEDLIKNLNIPPESKE